MDTGTHLVIGLGLAGLAHIDPVIASDPVASTAVLIGTVAGQTGARRRYVSRDCEATPLTLSTTAACRIRSPLSCSGQD